MLELGKENLDLQKNSLSLFGQEVIIQLRPDSDTSDKYGDSVCGKLIGRVWGERVMGESDYVETVIAITVSVSDMEEVTIPYQDIISVKEVKA